MTDWSSMSWESTRYSMMKQQAVKNMELATKMERVAGIQTGGQRAGVRLLHEGQISRRIASRPRPRRRQRHADQQLHGRDVYSAAVLRPKPGSQDRGIEHFDGWAAQFGEVVDTMEISPDGATLKPRSRFAKFVNLPELVQMFRAFADVQTADMI